MPSKIDFSKFAENFVYDSLALSPVNATAAGYHEHKGVKLDEKIDDYSAAGVTRTRKFYQEIQEVLRSTNAGALSPEDRADYQIIEDQAGLALLEINQIQSFRHNPTLYVELAGNALFNPFVLDYAPKADRYRQIIARLDALPALYQQARKNLADSPEVWNRVAREEDAGNADLIDKTLRSAAPPALRSDYDRAAATALAALRQFDEYLKNDLSKKTSDWRLGAELYAQKFRYTLDAGKQPEQVLREAEAALQKAREEMARLAAPETIPEALARIAREHSTPETYMADARTALRQATDFVREKKLVPLTGEGNLQVIPTPEFMRGTYSVGGFDPAPALEPQLGAFFWITPIPNDWPQQRIESKLREYNLYSLQELTIHEAMPGHYVQFQYGNRVEPRARRLLRSVYANNVYVEGWAVYAQELMSDQGYLNNSKDLRLTYLKWMLRAIANAILDVRLQTMNMSESEAMDLMINQTFQEKEEATGKFQRAQLTSCQLPTYFVGWRDWLDTRDEYRKRKGAAFNLEEFHQRALETGAVPMPWLSSLLR